MTDQDTPPQYVFPATNTFPFLHSQQIKNEDLPIIKDFENSFFNHSQSPQEEKPKSSIFPIRNAIQTPKNGLKCSCPTADCNQFHCVCYSRGEHSDRKRCVCKAGDEREALRSPVKGPTGCSCKEHVGKKNSEKLKSENKCSEQCRGVLFKNSTIGNLNVVQSNTDMTDNPKSKFSTPKVNSFSNKKRFRDESTCEKTIKKTKRKFQIGKKLILK